MKNKGYIILICLGVITYFIIWLFVPKIETLNYEDYKISIEYKYSNQNDSSVEDIPSTDEPLEYIMLANIEEFSSKYKGELPLLNITKLLSENINNNFKKLKIQEQEDGINKTFTNNRELINKYFGITDLESFKELSKKFDSLIENDIISASIVVDSCNVEDDYTTFFIDLKLSNDDNIIFTVQVNNYAKTDKCDMKIF